MKAKQCAVGIDFGTTSLSAVVVDIREKEILKVLNCTTDAYVMQPDPLAREQSVDILEKLFRNLVDEIDAMDGIEVKAYGFTGQMHGIVGVNGRGEAVTNLVTWEDRSGETLLPDGEKMLDRIKSLSGDPTLSSGYGVVTLYKWLAVEKREDIAGFCTIADYFAGRMAGRIAMSPSMAHSVGLFDIVSNTWNRAAIEKTGLDFNVFPRIVKENSILGQADGRIVVSAAGDNQASFSGSVFDDRNALLLNVGTGAQVSMLLLREEKKNYEKYIDGFETQIRPYDEYHYLIAAGFINGGASYKALFNFFKESGSVLFGIGDVDENKLWESMEAAAWPGFEAGGFPGASHLLSGERNKPGAKASFAGITPLNFRPGDFIAAFLTAMTEYYKSAFPEELISKAERIYGGGNGLKRNRLLVKIAEKTFGRPIRLTPYNEEAAVGAAMNAIKALPAVPGKQPRKAPACIEY